MQRKRGVSARQQLSVQQQNGIWTLVQSEEAEIQPRSDEKRILSNVAVLEGAPPLSEHWQLFNNNEVLFNEARTAQAATVVFFFYSKMRKSSHWPAAFIPCVASAVVR